MTDRLRRNTRCNRVVRNVLRDDSTCRDDDVVADIDIIHDLDVCTDENIIADIDAADLLFEVRAVLSLANAVEHVMIDVVRDERDAGCQPDILTDADELRIKRQLARGDHDAVSAVVKSAVRLKPGGALHRRTNQCAAKHHPISRIHKSLLSRLFLSSEKLKNLIFILIKHVDTARKHGRLVFHDDILISRKQVEKLEDNKICFIATGSQGEGASVITKIAENDYSNIKVRKDDTFVFSSRIIPGNEHRLIYIINNVYEKGGTVITADDLPIHVSGHAAKEDALLLLNILKPKYLVPIHGEVQHLVKHKKLAIDHGMIDENVIFFLAGNKIIFENGSFIEKQEIPAGKRYVDLNTEEFLTHDELKNRKKLAINGAVVVVNSAENVENINENNIIIQLIGFSIEKEYINILKQSIIEYSQIEESGITQKADFNEFAEQTVKRFFKKRFSKRPHISIINTYNGAV